MCRELAVQVGGFDPSCHNCNDWDFYGRLAAEGARFTRIDAVIPLYHIAEANRLSHGSAAGSIDAKRVQAHRSSPRARVRFSPSA